LNFIFDVCEQSVTFFENDNRILYLPWKKSTLKSQFAHKLGHEKPRVRTNPRFFVFIEGYQPVLVWSPYTIVDKG
jgi:hypothetical protein